MPSGNIRCNVPDPDLDVSHSSYGIIRIFKPCPDDVCQLEQLLGEIIYHAAADSLDLLLYRLEDAPIALMLVAQNSFPPPGRPFSPLFWCHHPGWKFWFGD